jgi:hypothetical protein
MKKFRVIFTVKEVDGDKKRGEVITKAKDSIDAISKVREALSQMNIKDITIVSSNEVVE